MLQCYTQITLVNWFYIGVQGGGATNFMDRAIINCAHALEEAWAWGFDVDVWRAHLNVQTWPEVSFDAATCHVVSGIVRLTRPGQGLPPLCACGVASCDFLFQS